MSGSLIRLSPASLIEVSPGVARLQFTVELLTPAANTFSVSYRTLRGTALAGLDFEQVTNGSLFFYAGETSKTIAIDVSADFLDERDENLILELYNPDGGAAFEGGQPTLRATGVILDDDGTGSNLALFVSNPQVVEGDSGTGQAVFELRLSRAPGVPVTVNYATKNGSAIAGTDYTAASGQVTFQANETVKFVAVNVAGEALAEVSEAFFLTVSPTTPLAPAAVGTATILDNDSGGGLPVLSLSGGSVVEVSSGVARLQFTATLSVAASSNFTVDFRTLDGTAQAGIDYNQITPSTVFFYAGDTSRNILINVATDFLDERDEHFAVELFNLDGGVVFAGGGPTLRATGVILDDDGTGSNLALFVSNPQIVEGDSGTRQAVFELKLSRPATTPLTFNYATADGSALAGADYMAKSGSVTFAAGQDTAFVAVNIFGNAIAEITEQFSLAVTPAAAAGVAPALGTATILDNDSGGGLPVLSLSGGSVVEVSSGVARLQFTATLSVAASSNFTVNFRTLDGTAQAGLDYGQITSSTVFFYAGETSRNILVNVATDALIEPSETVILELFNLDPGIAFAGGGTTLRATGVIIDNDGQFLGSAGNDVLDGTPIGDTLPGAAGNDLLRGLGGSDSLAGGLGNDTLRGGEGIDTLDGGDGADLLEGGLAPDVLIGGNGIDRADYGASNGAVDVTLLTGRGAGGHAAGDTISGVENVSGSAFADRLEGNALANQLLGQGGADSLVGGGGNDLLNGGVGADSMVGGVGNDIFVVDSAGDIVVEAVGQGVDEVRTTLGTYALGANVENLVATNAVAHTLTGNALSNSIVGNAGADTIRAANGNDRLQGGGGNDWLIGGMGADTLTGGAGADLFRLTTATESSVAAPDLILDFVAGTDSIDLRNLDANSFVAGNQAFTFIGSAAFGAGGAATAGQLRVTAAGGGVFVAAGDIDGNGVADFALRVAASAAPGAGWFLL